MSLLFETVRIAHGVPQHLSWHEKRMERALKEFWDDNRRIVLRDLIRVPGEFRKGIVRCNIAYGPFLEEVTFKHYEKKPVRSLRLVTCNEIDYHVKYSDRSFLEKLLEQRGECDEVLIVKEGFITDTSMSNVIFLERDDWITPSTPLLGGTTRERLLAAGQLSEKRITPADLPRFSGCKLINAMRLPEEEELISIDRIV